MRGGAFWGQVLSGRLPVNFFQSDPFVGSARAMINDGSSTYHGLEIEVRRRFARGLALQSNYTFGKAISDYDGDENTLLNDVRPSSVRDPRYSRQEIMPRQQFNAYWVYELPLGAGKPLLSAAGPWQKAAAAGQVRDLVGTRDIGGSLFFLDPCLSAFLGGACTDASAPRGLLTLPEPGSLGQLGQTVYFGPSRFVIDMSLMKRTPIGEGKDLEFRWEVFNVLNHANFNVPTQTITNSNFGQITRT